MIAWDETTKTELIALLQQIKTEADASLAVEFVKTLEADKSPVPASEETADANFPSHVDKDDPTTWVGLRLMRYNGEIVAVVTGYYGEWQREQGLKVYRMSFDTDGPFWVEPHRNWRVPAIGRLVP